VVPYKIKDNHVPQKNYQRMKSGQRISKSCFYPLAILNILIEWLIE